MSDYQFWNVLFERQHSNTDINMEKYRYDIIKEVKTKVLTIEMTTDVHIHTHI